MPAAPPPTGANPLQSVSWQGKPNPDLLKRYVAWMNTVMADCAKRWNRRLFYAYTEDKKSFLAYVFDPGKPPKLVQRQ